MESPSRSLPSTIEVSYFLVVCDLPTCSNLRRIAPLEEAAAVRWMHDGQSIAYARVDGPNIWVQPLDGSAPSQLTHFTDGRTILDFAWSRDGKRLAIVRATIANDIVLLKGFQPAR